MADSAAMGEAVSREPVEVRVLGPFGVSVGGRRVELSSARLRVMLAVLAMSSGRAVSIDRLVDGVWGEELPANARRTVQTYVTRLRMALGAEAITTEPAGYVLRTVPANVDALQFVRLLDRAADESPAVERVLLAEALNLWRGQPFEGLDSAWLARTEAHRLDERRLAALERRIDLDLADGHAGEVVGELRDLVSAYPLRESIWTRFLIALAGAGRQAEAFEQYETIRSRIADQLGVDPGTELRGIYADLLDGRLSGADSRTAGERPDLVVPRQLPADISGFTGRGAVLAELDALLAESYRGGGRPGVVASVHGAGGAGKTTLAVHWAHRVADDFPDGQLYLNLRGFGTESSVAPAAALDALLRGLGVPGEQIPAELDARTNLLRSRLADRRMLIILDNARDAEQVRPLVPGSGDSFVVVTSRSQLRGLVAREGARRIMVDVLDPTESAALLASVLDDGGVRYDDPSLAELAEQCGHLPLALAIAAERATRQPELGLAETVMELREERERLDVLDAGGDTATDLRAVFAWSYQALDADTARLFRLLGLHPGPDIGLRAAATLADISVPKVRRLLDRLVDGNLLHQRRAGRYEFHDLVRVYASDLAEQCDPQSERDHAYDRAVEWYARTVASARKVLAPQPALLDIGEPTDVRPLVFDGIDQAIGWMETERQVLVATVHAASATGRDRWAFHLADLMWTYLMRQRAFDDIFATLAAVSNAAERMADRSVEAQCANCLGMTYTELLEYAEAHAHFERALALFTAAGHDRGQLSVLDNLGVTAGCLQDKAASADYHKRSLAVARRLGDPRKAVNPLNNLAAVYVEMGQHEAATQLCREAVEICREHGWEHPDHSMLWDTYGIALAGRQRYADAIRCFERALELARQAQDRWNECIVLTNLGRCLRDDGQPAEASAAWRLALDIFDQLGTPDGLNVSRADLVDLLSSVGGHAGNA